MIVFKRFAFFFLLICAVCITGGWGYLVHKTTHQLAVYELPSSMQKFYYRNIKYLVDSAPRPDMRRGRDSLEANRHFIDLEKFSESAYTLPRTWAEAVAKYSKDSLLLYGYVPYVILDTREKLVNAFRTGNADSILYYSADLGHYIADANVPLHSSMNYDGQLSGQKGLHSLWESLIPQLGLANYNLRSSHKARYVKNPAEEILHAIQRSNELLPELFAQEKEVAKNFTDATKYEFIKRGERTSRVYTAAFARSYALALKSTVNDQLIHSADMIADFWYSCWVDAGEPDLSSLTLPAFTKSDKKALKKELKSFKRNNLISDSLLRAKSTVIWTD